MDKTAQRARDWLNWAYLDHQQGKDCHDVEIIAAKECSALQGQPSRVDHGFRGCLG
jgi:hypothetical protein